MFKVWYKRSTGQLGTGRFEENSNFKVHPGPKSDTSIWKTFYQVPQKGRPMFRLLLIVAQQEQPTPPSRP